MNIQFGFHAPDYLIHGDLYRSCYTFLPGCYPVRKTLCRHFSCNCIRLCNSLRRCIRKEQRLLPQFIRLLQLLISHTCKCSNIPGTFRPHICQMLQQPLINPPLCKLLHILRPFCNPIHLALHVFQQLFRRKFRFPIKFFEQADLVCDHL